MGQLFEQKKILYRCITWQVNWSEYNFQHVTTFRRNKWLQSSIDLPQNIVQTTTLMCGHITTFYPVHFTTIMFTYWPRLMSFIVLHTYTYNCMLFYVQNEENYKYWTEKIKDITRYFRLNKVLRCCWALTVFLLCKIGFLY